MPAPCPACCAPRAEQDVTAAARDLVELVKHLCLVARDPRSAVFVMELFRGSPTARNKAAVSAVALLCTACKFISGCCRVLG